MMGIVSDEDFELELSKSDKSQPAITEAAFNDIARGRGPVGQIPAAIREIIAEDAIAGVPAREVAEKFGISESSVSAYKHDATSTASYHESDKMLAKANEKVRTEIITTAKARLLEALNHITPAKLADAKVRDVASVAKDMSAVIHNTEPQSVNGIGNAQFIFHVPKSKQEKDFDIIDVA
jgi:transposase